MATLQSFHAIETVHNVELRQELERLRREVALLEEQHGYLQEDVFDEDGYSLLFKSKNNILLICKMSNDRN